MFLPAIQVPIVTKPRDQGQRSRSVGRYALYWMPF